MSRTRNTFLALIAVGVAASVAAPGTFASFNAQAGSTSSVTSGTLLMTLTHDGTSTGLPETISTMAPGDIYNVYVNLNNTGTLASAGNVTLGWSASPANALTNNSISGAGLSVAITQCSVAWTMAGGTCSGTTTTTLASTMLGTAASPVNLTNVSSLYTAGTGTLAHLQFQVTLTDSASDTSTNGTLPSPTMQGLTTTLTWTITETQRAAQTTNT